MFGWFRRRKPQKASQGLANVLDLPDESFAETVTALISRAEPAERAMIVVAFYNLGLMVGAMKMGMAREGKRFDEEASLRDLLKSDNADPLSQRRIWWFSCGYLVRRLDRLAASSPPLAANGAQVWSDLIEGARFVPSLLRNNVVWRDDEKAPLLESMAASGQPSPVDAMQFAFRYLMPKDYRSQPQIQDVKARHGLTTHLLG